MKEHRRSTNQLEPTYDADGVQATSGLNEKGQELPDPVPMSPPVGYEPPSQLEALIESVIRRRDFLAALRANDIETPEEADDFEVDEDYDPRFEPTIYEEYFEAKSRRAAQTARGAVGGREGGVPSAPPSSANVGGSVSQETGSNVKRSEGDEQSAGSDSGSDHASDIERSGGAREERSASK